MIDLHCHILPGLDDGSASVEESLAMAKTALQDGIHTVVATPHSLDGMYMNSLGEVTGAVESFRGALAENGLDLRLFVGADVHLCPTMVERVRRGEAVTINNAGRYLLLELPPQTLPEGLHEEIFSLKIHGVTPIITHPERHPAIQRDLGVLRDLISHGALAQVTAMSVCGDFGGLVAACAEAMLGHRLVHIIASDAHSADSRPPVLSRAVEAAEEILGSREEAEWMVEGLPAAILAGRPVEVPVPAKIQKSFSLRGSA
ncbi:MAG: CpsB/CapC family capsule biosynthesis tyrosine phosphatase [Thermodesulfobacteriota bacterium]